MPHGVPQCLLLNGFNVPKFVMPMRQVCGLDVHKDSVFVCIINENGVVCQEKFGILTTDLEKMLCLLKQYDVGEVCMESTSVYWIPVWRVGFDQGIVSSIR